MGKVVKLICVTSENNNKFYHMNENSDGTFTATYGRVDKTSTEKQYPMSNWDKIYRAKTKKGYSDMTHLFVEETTDDTGTVVQATIKDAAVNTLVNELQKFANKSITENYKVSSNKVTQAMIDAAQEIVNDIIKSIKIGVNRRTLNDKLLKLYATIPRQMKRVQEHLFDEFDNAKEVKSAKEKMADEQDTLDVMAGQVALNVVNDTSPAALEHKTILDSMGLEMVEGDAKDYKIVKDLMKGNANQCKKVFVVVHKGTQIKYDSHVKKSKNKKSQLFFHGSRNQNWFNILSTGLLIRPSGAIHTGSMFGDGIYGADKARKAIGYTSVRGSYWASGSSNKGFLGVFEFHTGNQKHIKRHGSFCYSLNAKGLSKEGFDSVYAHGGIDLRNDEFIVYRSEQCTVKYLVEIN